MNRIIVVTGGTKGIGRAIAGKLARDGVTVIAVARHAGDLPAGVSFAAGDVTDRESIKNLFAGLPRVDALINAAGLAGPNPLAPDDPLWHAILAVNLTGPWLCSTAALPKIPDQVGRIINISSTLGLRGVPDQPAYCAAKHGLIGLTRSLALAVAARGITVNAICPGWVDTDMAHARFHDLGITPAQAAQSVPMGRIATPGDVAGIVAFLLSPVAAHLTGHALPVDGGALASA
ncbi:MAG: SDR family oxidoreductase [Acetobacteraceae bacterium]|nr:SDR family oxidoreductase [Acetobacteraceae bacterium]MSP29405.1 SDR family oxidoreductase [Acetobacteraceae bacterium]